MYWADRIEMSHLSFENFNDNNDMNGKVRYTQTTLKIGSFSLPKIDF
jgi:hypothetical protein